MNKQQIKLSYQPLQLEVMAFEVTSAGGNAGSAGDDDDPLDAPRNPFLNEEN